MGSVGVPELIVIFVVALLVFGPRELPKIGKTLGKALAEFQKARNELISTVEEEVRKIESEPSTTESSTPSTTETSTPSTPSTTEPFATPPSPAESKPDPYPHDAIEAAPSEESSVIKH